MHRFVGLFVGSIGILPYGCHEKVVGSDNPGAPTAAVGAGGGGTAPSMPGLPSGSPASADQLRVAIGVAGMPVTSRQLACGQCIDMSVDVSGGRAPYAYSWSDKALSGRGPHHVCPRGPVDYSVHVVDTPSQGEFRRASLQADAQLHLDVGPCLSMPDSGPGPNVGHDAGRVTRVDGGPTRQDASLPPRADAGTQSRVCPCSNAVTWSEQYFADPSFENLSAPTRAACSGTPTNALISSSGPGGAPDGAFYLGLSLPTSETETLRQPLLAGQRYWLSWDMASSSQITAFTGIPLGVVDIYGATFPCATDELLGEQTFKPTDSGGWIHVCTEFVPSRNYPYVVISARVANGTGTGFVSLDAIRVAPYTPSPTDYLWPNCSFGALSDPFP